tara:strand:- start:1737 stop:2582 length:846 start_codon:yes stop_codon:yes gene_type:complete
MSIKIKHGEFAQLHMDELQTANTHKVDMKTHLEDIKDKLTDGTQKSLVWGANDILGNTPRCLTVDGNGRLMTYPYEHPSSWTNTHLTDIKAHHVTAHTHLDNIHTKLSNNIVVNLTGNSAVDGTGSNYHVASSSQGAIHITAPDGVAIAGTMLGGGEQAIRVVDGAILVHSRGTTGEWLASQTLADDNYSTHLDCSEFQNVRLMGKSTNSVTYNILGSQTSSGTYYSLNTEEHLSTTWIEIAGVGEYHLKSNITNCPNFIKIYNNSGSIQTLEVDYIGYGN